MGCTRRRAIKLAVAAALLAFAQLGAAALTPEANLESAHAAGAREPRVVCITDFEPFLGIYAFRPRHCLLHERGVPFSAGSLLGLKRMRWQKWGPGRARGKGKLISNADGLTPVRVSLTRVRTICGERVFTRVRFRSRPGGGIRGKGSFRPDDCLR